MPEFQASDFIPIEEFGLAWRWTDPRQVPLPPDVLRQLQPLMAAKAQEVAAEARARCLPSPAADDDLVILVEGGDPEPARQRLQMLGIDRKTSVVLSWNGTTALLASWGVFLDHWEAFCYPSSDDVTIWELGQPWTLYYRHFEAFHFASPSRAV